MRKKKTGTLTTQFAIMLFIFGFIIIGSCSYIAYYNESSTYKDMELDRMQETGRFIERMIHRDSDDFIKYVEYFKDHADELEIPYDFDNYSDAYEAFNAAFAERYPGKVLGVDVTIDELSDDLKKLYFTYDQEYWTLLFEDARDNYDLLYTYFLLMEPDGYLVTYMIDGGRFTREDNPELLIIGDTVDNDYDKFKVEWETWFQQKALDEFQIWDNEYGHNYAHYVPVLIEGEEIGLIGLEVQIDTVNQEILERTIKMASGIFAVMILGIAVLLYLIHCKYLRKLHMLTELVEAFSESKDPDIAELINHITSGRTEVSELSRQTANMIREIDKYTTKLVTAVTELDQSRKREAESSELAMKDPLTGIRNKTAYDKVCLDIDFKIADGYKDFGIAMIDLNFLKRINDLYGHDKGNIAIVDLCRIICKTFSHSPVFRIGGDEFVAILQNDDYVNADELVEMFFAQTRHLSNDESLEHWERISAAIGIAKYDPEIDKNVNNVFKRADMAMYECKKRMRAVRN